MLKWPALINVEDTSNEGFENVNNCQLRFALRVKVADADGRARLETAIISDTAIHESPTAKIALICPGEAQFSFSSLRVSIHLDSSRGANYSFVLNGELLDASSEMVPCASEHKVARSCHRLQTVP